MLPGARCARVGEIAPAAAAPARARARCRGAGGMACNWRELLGVLVAALLVALPVGAVVGQAVADSWAPAGLPWGRALIVVAAWGLCAGAGLHAARGA